MGSGSSLVPPDKKIVIVGAGYGGAMLGVALMKQRTTNFTIIDISDAFYHNVGAVRAAIEPDFARKLFIPYANTFGDKFKQGKVLGINTKDRKVTLESGEEIEYDVLVISTGSTGFNPYKKNPDHADSSYIKDFSAKMYNQVKDSKEFVIIGGGAVGCEIAGELATDFKDAKITLIHPSEVLVGESLAKKGKFQKVIKEKLTSKNVKLALGEKVVSGLEDSGIYGPCDVVTDKGNTYHGDTVFRCTGTKVNSQAYSKDLADVTNPNGSLQVNEFLQVKGHPEIFAIGDCTDVPEMKLAYRAGLHVEVVKTNINALFKNEAKLKAYDPAAAPMAGGVSLGRKDGAGMTTGGTMLPTFIINSFKSKDLMVGQQWKQMKQKLPA